MIMMIIGGTLESKSELHVAHLSLGQTAVIAGRWGSARLGENEERAE